MVVSGACELGHSSTLPSRNSSSGEGSVVDGLGDRASIGRNAEDGDLCWWCAGFLPAGLSAREVEDESRGITLCQARVVGDALVHAAAWPVVAEAPIDANRGVASEVECSLGSHGIGLCASRGGEVQG